MKKHICFGPVSRMRLMPRPKNDSQDLVARVWLRPIKSLSISRMTVHSLDLVSVGIACTNLATASACCWKSLSGF